MIRLFTFSMILLTALLAVGKSAHAGAEVAYDFVNHFSDAKIANALTAKATGSTAGGVQKPSIFLHPTEKEATATYQVTLPSVSQGDRLLAAYSVGIRDGIKTDDAQHPFDGVKFVLRVDGKEQFSTELKETRWIDGATDLTSMAGKQIEVVFATSPIKSTNYAWAAWGEPKILKLSGGLLGSGNAVKTAKGILVFDSAMGANKVEIMPTGIPGKQKTAKSQTIAWSTPQGAAGPSKTEVIPFDFAELGATGVELRFTDQISGAQVYEFSPRLEIASFGPSNALLLSDTPAELRCTVRNTGDGILHASSGTKATVTASFPASSQSIGDLAPGAQKTLVWPNVKLQTGTAGASIKITGQGIGDLTASWSGSVVKMPSAVPFKVTQAECRRLSDGTVLLQNPKLRMMFLKNNDGYAGWMASIPRGSDWTSVASGGPFGKVVAGDENHSTYLVYPKDVKLSDDPGVAPAVSFTAEKQIGKAQCRFEWTFTLDRTESRITMTNSMTSPEPLDILHFSGPMVYAGDQGFGAIKDEGLFPGLEYLLAESSSGTENASAPYDLRTVPHPNKITIPLMAIRNRDALVSLEWDPLQKWDGTADKPSALYASPNFLDGGDNHKMGIFAPSVPEWVPENQQIAAKPYKLEAGKTLSLTADLVVKQGSKTVLDAVEGWVARHKLPAPAEPESPIEEYLNLCDNAYFGGAWDDAAKAWKHTNTGPVFFDPMIATYMWNRADYYVEPDPYQKRLMDFAGSAAEKAKESRTLDVALLAGGVEDALNRMANSANQRIAAQQADGSWPFQPDKAHEVFGKPGDSSSGFTANNAIDVLHYALVSGDTKARAAGLKALKYLDTQSRPEGSQTWELQLHVPDILASARLVEAYLSGYELTDDKAYLDKAVYWAKSGLPFVYMWNASDRPIMRYGTIPVFGATWFNAQPWFGVCVQWCGCDYAYSLGRLASYDNSMDWKRISEGILKCAIQQQEYIKKKYPADAGMYPDAFSPLTGEEEYHWDLNPRLISRLAMQYLGADGFPRSSGFTDRYGSRLTITAPANVVKMTSNGEILRTRIVGAPKTTIYMILSGVHSPMGIGIKERNLPQYNYTAGVLDRIAEGYVYFDDKALTIIKIKTQPEMDFAVDLFNHQAYQQDTESAKKKADKNPKK